MAIKKYPYTEVLIESKFYPDEAYDDGPNHENASGCDMCLEPAQYMTFSAESIEPPDGEAYYICERCVKEYRLEDMIE